jgi:hypothetical protein
MAFPGQERFWDKALVHFVSGPHNPRGATNQLTQMLVKRLQHAWG